MKINQLNSPSIARNIDKTSVSQAKSAAKLAAAKQILGAGDDPAGLAITNKMQSQLGGLNMAARNTQDAVSLLKTADGATQALQSILGRMGELAVQSANGILSNSDRELLNTEFTQLREEINSISNSANFNNINLLDGSLSALGAQRTADSVGLNVVTTAEPAVPAVETAVTYDDSQVTQGRPAQIEIDLNNYQINGAQAGESFALNIGGSQVSLTLNAGDYNSADLASGIAQAYDGGSVNIEGQNYTVAAQGSTLTFTYDNNGQDKNNIQIDSARLAAMPVTAEYASASGTQSGAVAAAPARVSAGIEYNAQPVQVNTVRLTGSLKVGDTFNMAGRRFEFVRPGQRPSAPEITPVSVFEAANNDQIMRAARDAIEMTFKDTYNITATSNSMQISQKTPGSGSVDFSVQQAPVKSSMVNFNPAKLQTGDQITLNITNSQGTQRSVTYTHAQGNTMNDIARTLGGSRIGNSLQFQGQSVSAEFKGVLAPASDMKIQSGATEGDTKGIGIKALNSDTLGIANIDISTQNGASKAISAISKAVGQVSEQRGTLGAMQNRMTSTLNNISVSIENQTAAQSRIEDLDMAQGIMQNMLQRIQQQAQLSVQAQSNINAQNILSLFQ